jgi:hypothetical protein
MSAPVEAVRDRVADLIRCINRPRCADGGSCGCRDEARAIVAIVEATPAREAFSEPPPGYYRRPARMAD